MVLARLGQLGSDFAGVGSGPRCCPGLGGHYRSLAAPGIKGFQKYCFLTAELSLKFLLESTFRIIYCVWGHMLYVFM